MAGSDVGNVYWDNGSVGSTSATTYLHDHWAWWNNVYSRETALTATNTWVSWTDTGTTAQTGPVYIDRTGVFRGEETATGVVWKQWVTIQHDAYFDYYTQHVQPQLNDSLRLRGEQQLRAEQQIRACREQAQRRPYIGDMAGNTTDAYKEIAKKKKSAEERAVKLLEDMIGEEIRIYNETGRLFVRGSKHDYMIQKEGLVKQIAKGKVTDLCVHLAERDRMPPTG